MSEHQKEAATITPQDVDSTIDSPKKSARLSRRRFLQSTVIGAGAAALAFKAADVALAAEDTTGQVTLDAVLITYVGAPPGCSGGTTWEYTKNRTNTYKLSLTLQQGISLRADTSGTTTTGVDKSKFTVGNSMIFRQDNSIQFTNAIFIRESLTRRLSTAVHGGATVADTGDTVFFGLFKPDATFTGNPTAGFRYRFLSARDTFTWPAYRFQAPDATVLANFKPSTLTAFLNQYPPTSSITPVQPGTTLPTPRFKLLESNFAAAGQPQAINRTSAHGSTFSLTLTSTFAIEITSSSGFTLTNGDTTVQQMFAVGKTFSLAVSGVQEVSTEKVISVTATWTRASDGVTKIYRDKVWKTMCVLDAGLPGPTALQGQVTDSTGAGIAGATVSLLNNNIYYTTTAGANGNFVLKTAAGQPLTPGASTLMCGGVTRSVTLNSSGTNSTFQPLSGVDRTLALNGSLDYAPVEN